MPGSGVFPLLFFRFSLVLIFRLGFPGRFRQDSLRILLKAFRVIAEALHIAGAAGHLLPSQKKMGGGSEFVDPEIRDPLLPFLREHAGDAGGRAAEAVPEKHGRDAA